jgi:hypothetical protein
MPQWTLFENDFRLIDGVLDDLLQRTNALSAHLIDRSGQESSRSGPGRRLRRHRRSPASPPPTSRQAELAQLMGEPRWMPS